MAHILDMSEEHIENHLRMTGQTREELEAFRAKYAVPEGNNSFDESDWIEGADPSQKEKFTMPIGFELVSDSENQTPKMD